MSHDQTFPTAYRNCSYGPMTVQEMPGTSTNHSKGKINNETHSSNINGIFGGSIAVFLLVVIAIICIVALRRSTSKGNNPVHMPAMRNITRDKNPPDQNISTNHKSRHGSQASSEQIPAYAEIQGPISGNLREDTMTNTDEDTNLSTIPEETVNFPIYSEVKEADETDKPKNKADDEDSAGMVENTIYVSSDRPQAERS